MYFVYIVRCRDRTLYTGIATDLKRRIFEHNNTKLGARYTASRRPIKLVYSKGYNNRSLAAKEESRIKKLQRTDKLSLIKKTSKIVE